MDNSLLYYQQKMEQFYDDLIEVIREKGCCLVSEDPYFEDYIDEHDLLIFEDTLQGMEYDDSIEEILDCLARKGYKIMMNFYREDVILGNVVVKLGKRWFAFGKCRRDHDGGCCVSEIWPLRYVLPRMEEMENQLKCVFPMDLH
jgi:hypothetical protein